MIVFWRCFELVIWFLVMCFSSTCSFCACISFAITALSWNVRRFWAGRATERPWWWGTTGRLKLARDNAKTRWKMVSFRNSGRIHAACCTHFVLLPYRWQFSSDVFSFYRYYVSAHRVLCHEESFYWSTSFYQCHFPSWLYYDVRVYFCSFFGSSCFRKFQNISGHFSFRGLSFMLCNVLSNCWVVICVLVFWIPDETKNLAHGKVKREDWTGGKREKVNQLCPSTETRVIKYWVIVRR